MAREDESTDVVVEADAAVGYPFGWKIDLRPRVSERIAR